MLTDESLEIFLETKIFETMPNSCVKQVDREIAKLICDENFRCLDYFKMFNPKFLAEYFRDGRYNRYGNLKFDSIPREPVTPRAIGRPKKIKIELQC